MGALYSHDLAFQWVSEFIARHPRASELAMKTFGISKEKLVLYARKHQNLWNVSKENIKLLDRWLKQQAARGSGPCEQVVLQAWCERLVRCGPKTNKRALDMAKVVCKTLRAPIKEGFRPSVSEGETLPLSVDGGIQWTLPFVEFSKSSGNNPPAQNLL